MKFTIPLFAILSLLFQACSILPGSYSAGGYSAGGYSAYHGVVKVELERVTGNDLKLIERILFIRKLKSELAQKGTVVIQNTNHLRMQIIINKYITSTRMYKEAQHGVVIYHLDESYKITAQYTIADRAEFTPVKSTINYNVTVRAKSAVDYDDAKRVAMKKVIEAFAKRVANDISAKGSILSSRYSIRTPDYKATHNNLNPLP